MEDVDMDDLFDGPAKGPAKGANRPSRFAPKGAQSKPKLKAEPSQPVPSVAAGSVVLKKEEPASKPDIKPDFSTDVVEMDVDVKSGVKDEDGNLMEAEATEITAESEDEVVREIDVYFTPSVDPKTRLYVLQYPLRPSWRPYELDERCQEVRVKLDTSEVEVDLMVDVDSKNYDAGADPRVQMKKQTLASSWKPPDARGYAVGVLNGNKLHLNPVHAIVQLRPSMKYLDSRDSKKKSGTPSNVEGVVKLEESQVGKPVGPSKKLSKVSEVKKDTGEGWVTVKYHNARTEMASDYLCKMLAQESSAINFTMSSLDYLNSLCPGTSGDNSSLAGPPGRSLLTLPLKERFKSWLLEGSTIHRFDALKYLAPDESVEEFLAVLQEYARLVQGLWLPKSSLVYGTDQGIQVLARDYVLLLFGKNVIINNSEIPQRPVLSKAMKDALSVLAVERPAFNDWKLKELPDTRFMKLYPSVVKKQEEEWKNMEKKINDILGARFGASMKSSTKPNVANTVTPSKGSNKVATKTSSGTTSITTMSEEAREYVMKSIQKIFKNAKVCRFQQIGQLLRDMAVSERNIKLGTQAVAAANSIAAYPEEFKAIVNEVATNIHGIYVPKSSADHPQYDAFRKVVIDLFLAEGPNAKLRKATILEAAKMELQRDVPNNEFQKVIGELCISQGAAWILKSGDGPKL